MKDELESEFIVEFMKDPGTKCVCSPDCTSMIYRKKGKLVDYIVQHETSGETETNIFIRIDMDLKEAMMKGIEPVVFNGFCESNMDFATTLRMVIK